MGKSRLQPLKRVIAALPFERVPGRAKMRGVLAYLHSHGDWDLSVIRTDAEFSLRKFTALAKDGVDGLLLSIPCTNPALAEAIANAPFPIVSMDVHDRLIESRQHNIAFISNASDALAEAAAGHLLAMGTFKTYAYVADADCSPWAVLRGNAFAAALAKHGIGCTSFGLDRPSADERLSSFLRSLVTPAAVFAANDFRAREIADCCRRLHLKIPSKIALLGVDDDYLLCENTTPTISSVRPDYEDEGFQAAAALDQMMRHPGKQPRKTILVGVKSVVRRDSTTPDTRAGALIRRALDYINANACTGISVDDVVRALKVSRRLADLRFREIQGETIRETITARKLEAVRNLLATTKLPIDSITSDCGFRNANHLKNLFKRRFGTSMRDYRRTRGVS